MVPSRLIAVPFILIFAVSIYLAVMYREVHYLVMIPSAIALVLCYVFSPQLDWWWWQRYPPDLHRGLKGLLSERSPFYQRLTEAGKREFRRRIFLFGKGHDFMPQVLDEVPEDVQLMIAVAPVAMTLQQEDFLFPNFENIIVYPHPFVSPQYQESFHASEIYEPDGVVMFCTDHIVRGFLQPRQYFNPAWYEYAKIYRLSYPEKDFSFLESTTWDDLAQISSFPQEAVERWIGLSDIDLTALSIAFYFLMPESFRAKLPQVYAQLVDCFQQDPIQPQSINRP